MARLITYSLFAFALSMLAIAAPLILPRQASVPSNVAPGTITTGCGQYITVQPGETCPLLEEVFNITNATLHALNPEINSDCSNLIAGEAYCVQPDNNSVAPPSNVAPGTITTGCAEYFTVQSGQSCDTIDTAFGITLQAFLTLNPEINSGCTNLIAGEAYCVESASG